MAESSRTEIPTIASESAKCVRNFKLVTQQLQALEQNLANEDNEIGLNMPKVDINKLDVSTELLTDTWARFNIWTSNIGALQCGRAALDHRLRHADVREEVLRLLRHLNSTLSHLFDIISGARQQEVWFSDDVVFEYIDGEFTDSDSEGEESENHQETVVLDSSSGGDSKPQFMTESHELALAMEEALSGLFQLSMFIHKSTRRNKFASFAADGSEPETQIDIRHVQDRFPFSMKNPELVERLGKANARRRQWLLYKKRHREKLAQAPSLGLESPIDGPSRLSLSLSSGIPHEDHAESSGMVGSGLSTIAPSEGFKSERSGLSSTVASTFYAVPSLVPDDEDHLSESGNSETTYSESLKGESEPTPSYIPQPPPESANGNPFECPYCFRIISITGSTSWAKHVHSDLSPYVCTQDGCAHAPFESRHQWFNHELEVHRLQWFCDECLDVMPSSKSFQKHMRQKHAQLVTDSRELQALTARAARPIREIQATECPLCDYNEILKQRRRSSASNLDLTGNMEPITLKLKAFRRHLGRHLEQLALFVLPKNDLVEMHTESIDIEASENPDLAELESDTDDNAITAEDQIDSQFDNPSGAGFSQDREDVKETGSLALTSEGLDLAFNDMMQSLDIDTSVDVAQLENAPELAMGWLPPMNFTPPDADFENENVDMIPRREDPMFGGDLFTPGWVREYGKDKEGFCGRCEPGVWLNIEDGSYMENLMYKHGIHSSGIPLPRPEGLRKHEGNWQGFCNVCQGWLTIRLTNLGWNWFRHCVREQMSKQDRSLVAEVRENEGKSKRVRQDSKGKTLGSDKDTGSPHLPMVDPRGWTALHHAAAFGDSRRVDEIITLTANDSRRRLVELLEQKTNTGETPLMLAAQQGNMKALKILINSGSRLDAVTPEGATALDLAARSGFRDICRVLIEHGDGALDFVLKSKEFIKLYKPYQKPLKRAPPLVEHSKSAASGSENITGSTLTPLMVAAMAGDKAATKELLESGADTECTIAETGETALMLAASNTHCGILSLLLSNGANIDATNAKGWTTLMLAARSDNLEVVDLLTSRGADVNHASPDHWTALAEAACRGNIAIIELLLKCKADTETRSMHDWTPLMHAAFKGDSEAVQLLLEYGADMNIISQHDETALLLAAAGKHTDICRTLLQAGCVLEPPWAIQYSYELGAVDNGGAESEVPDNPSALTLGWTPLMLACQNGLEEVVRMLITRGVQLRPKSPYGKTALKIAVENGRHEIVELLREYTDA